MEKLNKNFKRFSMIHCGFLSDMQGISVQYPKDFCSISKGFLFDILEISKMKTIEIPIDSKA